jgi:hypoxanthine phosphoribosyltransferase
MDSERFECQVMDWNYFYNLARKVADKINSSGYKPDIIVGLARGGWVLARILCDFVGIKDLVSLKVEHWGVTATPDGTAKLKHPLNVDLTGKKVLVVDDITDTGESMRVTVEYLKSLNPSEIRSAASNLCQIQGRLRWRSAAVEMGDISLELHRRHVHPNSESMQAPKGRP